MLSLLLLFLPGYIYDHHDWLNLPAMDRVVSISGDNYSGFVGVTRGVYEIDRGSRKLVHTFTSADGIRGEVRAVYYDPKMNLLWILSSGNLLALNPFSDVATSYPLPEPEVNSLGAGTDHIYLASPTGSHRMSKLGGVYDTLSPARDKVAWYGSLADGKASDYGFLTPYAYYDKEMNRHPITTVFREGRWLWVGTEGYGALLYNAVTGTLVGQWQLGPAISRVRSIFNSQGSIWFAGDEMLTRYSPQRDTWAWFPTPFNIFYLDSSLLLRSKVLDLAHHEPILAVAEDTLGSWLGTTEGIYYYTPKGNVLTQHLLLKSRANAILIDRDSVFIGTDDGLIRYDRASRAWSLFNDTMQQMHFGAFGVATTSRRRYYAVYGGFETQDSLADWELLTPPGWNLSMHPEALAAVGNRLFAGSDDGVIVYDERTGAYSVLNTDSGLLSNRVFSLCADPDYLWIATDAGISRFNLHALFP